MRIKKLGSKMIIIKDAYVGVGSGAHILELMRKSGQFDDIFKGSKMSDTKERSDRSIKRTIQRMKELLQCNLDDKSYFMTLTFAENQKDYKKAYRSFNNWVEKIRRVYGIDLKYMSIKELQKRGAIHYHLVVFDMESSDIAFKVLREWRHGRVHIKKIKNLYAWSIANYLGDYMSKKEQSIHANKRVFTTSRNLKQPIIIPDYVVEYVRAKYPKEKLTEFDYDTINAVDLARYMFGFDKVNVV